MLPNLRSAVAQCWRSIGSRRNFFSISGRNGKVVIVLSVEKRSLIPSFMTFPFPWVTTGYAIYAAKEFYNILEVDRKSEREYQLPHQLLDKKIAEYSNK